MNIRRGRWIVSLIMLWLTASPGLNWAAEGESSKEVTPAEGEVGTRAMPTQKQGMPSPLGTQIPNTSRMAAMPASPNPTSCVKSNPTGLSQPVAPTHYYSVRSAMPVVPLNPYQAEMLRPHLAGTIYAKENPSPVSNEVLGLMELHLPHGAVIREMSIHVNDNSGKQNIRAALLPFAGVSLSIASVSPSGGALLSLESDCLPMNTWNKMVANNLAVPVDGRYVYNVELSLVPAQTPIPQPGVIGFVYIDIITIGYTMQ